MARPFDPRRVRFDGEAFPIAEQVRYLAAARLGVFSTSHDGVLVYQGGGQQDIRELVWVGRNGERLGTLGDFADYADVRISPDGERVAAAIRDPHLGTSDIWIYDVASGVRNRFTFDLGIDGFPLWAPDGESIIFASTYTASQLVAPNPKNSFSNPRRTSSLRAGLLMGDSCSTRRGRVYRRCRCSVTDSRSQSCSLNMTRPARRSLRMVGGSPTPPTNQGGMKFT